MLRRALSLLLGGLLALPSAPVLAAAPPTRLAMVQMSMPSDFASLAESQHVVVDAFFGGRPIGQFEADTTPGKIRLLHPDQLVAALPGLSDPRAVGDALAGDLDTNSRYLCTSEASTCGRPTPDAATVVYDAQHFRMEVLVNPRLLIVRPVSADRYLSPSSAGLSLVDTVGGAVAGGDGESPIYSARNRAVFSLGSARLQSEMSVASGRGVDVDTLSAEIDRPDKRYAAGLYYVPGADLIGRRRIVGAGVASQFDTRADRTLISGSSLVVFLGQRSRVDIYVAGRLVGSHLYDAGNQTLDTSSLPDGSYPVELHIQETGGATRVEQRFFSKSAAIPPAGHTIFFAHAGLLATDRDHQLFAVSHVPIAVAGAARRVGTHFAWDATMMATNRKGLAEIGVSLLTKPVQARIGLLGSTTGDYGVVVQATSASTSRLSYNLDLRHVQSHDGRPLIPLDDYDTNPFSVSSMASQRTLISGTTFTQAIANLSWRIARAQFGVSGYARHDVGQKTSYAVGPTLHWSIVQTRRTQLSFDGSYAETDRGRNVAFGLRLQLFGSRSSVNATVGGQTATDSGRVAGLAEIGGSIQRDLGDAGRLTASGAMQKNADGTLIQAAADERGPMGYVSGSVLHRIQDGYGSTQYALAGQTSIGISRHAFRVGAHDQNDSIIAVKLDGAAKDVRFQVMVDDTPEGIIRPGGRLTISVPPYRRYVVRVRPVGGDLVAFDTKPRTVDVYPGSVAALAWRADPVLAMFGRLVHPDGRAIANADVSTNGAISATDERGVFQIQAAGDSVLQIRMADGSTCRAALAQPRSDKPYIALGDVTCRP
jgi:Mat/Ecp fimbriae outer membrane usher protein